MQCWRLHSRTDHLAQSIVLESSPFEFWPPFSSLSSLVSVTHTPPLSFPPLLCVMYERCALCGLWLKTHTCCGDFTGTFCSWVFRFKIYRKFRSFILSLWPSPLSFHVSQCHLSLSRLWSTYLPSLPYFSPHLCVSRLAISTTCVSAEAERMEWCIGREFCW